MAAFTKKGHEKNSCLLDKKKGNWEPELGRKRIVLLSLSVFIIFLLVFFRLFHLQISSHEDFEYIAKNQHTIFQTLIPKRGEIFLSDKEGRYPLAVNRDTKMAYAVPKEVINPEKISFEVAKILNLDAVEVLDKLKKNDDGYEPLKHRLNEEEIEGIRNLNAEGIRLLDEAYRYYPSNELASTISGFVGWQGDELSGRYGIESYFEKELRGEEGSIFQNRDTAGRWISIGKREFKPAQNGSDIILTVDRVIQYETEKILRGAIEKFEADAGSVVVMNPETGKILAMADYPNYNPNDYSQVEDINVFRNSSISVPYECGSVFKPITMAMGIDSGKITPETTYTDTGTVLEAGYAIKNSEEKVYGLQTMTGVLENSINTGVIFVEKQLGNKNFLEYTERFGFGKKTGIDIAGEHPGNIKNLDYLNRDIQFFTASFGQGITVTPIQLASAFSAIANGGKLMKPQIVEKMIYENGSKEEIFQPSEVHRVISESAAKQVAKMLQSVVENGHGKRGGVPGYLVGGKTGTAQIASTESKGYEEGINNGSFVGFAPIDNPQFTIVVKVENPKAVEWAESSAAPIFGELMKFLLEYKNIEPTQEYTQEDLNVFYATHNLGKYKIEEKKEDNKDEDNKED